MTAKNQNSAFDVIQTFAKNSPGRVSVCFEQAYIFQSQCIFWHNFRAEFYQTAYIVY